MDYALDWMDESFFVYNRVGGATISETLALFEYVAKKYGVHHFFIDPLMRVDDVNEEEASTIKELMNWLQSFAKKFDVHVHLVCHSRKSDSRHPEEKYPPMKQSVSGTKAITNNADNVVCVWRNKEKELDLAEAYDVLPTLNATDQLLKQAEIDEIKGRQDSRFLIQKCREDGTHEGAKALFFDFGDGGSWQYREAQNDPIRSLIPGFDAVEEKQT
jgi:twinkle protein